MSTKTFCDVCDRECTDEHYIVDARLEAFCEGPGYGWDGMEICKSCMEFIRDWLTVTLKTDPEEILDEE